MYKIEFKPQENAHLSITQGNIVITNKQGTYVNSHIVFKDSCGTGKPAYNVIVKANTPTFKYFDTLQEAIECVSSWYITTEKEMAATSRLIKDQCADANAALNIRLAEFGGLLNGQMVQLKSQL